ncbi:MAG: MBL fold metallo-hydrolase [Phototrophicaceae bacterium]
MSIEIHSQTLGLASTNTYLIGDTTLNEAILIDPVDDAPTLFEWASQLGWTIRMILATHAHFDHVLASAPLKQRTQAPFYIHQEAVPMLNNLPQTGLRFGNELFPAAAVPDAYLEDEQIISLGDIQLTCLYTPGHAPGHIAFYLASERVVFSGDTLFAGSIGRTDLPGSHLPTLLKSIRTRLLTLDDDVKVLSGHLEATTIGQERKHNPYLLGTR